MTDKAEAAEAADALVREARTAAYIGPDLHNGASCSECGTSFADCQTDARHACCGMCGINDTHTTVLGNHIIGGAWAIHYCRVGQSGIYGRPEDTTACGIDARRCTTTDRTDRVNCEGCLQVLAGDPLHITYPPGPPPPETARYVHLVASDPSLTACGEPWEAWMVPNGGVVTICPACATATGTMPHAAPPPTSRAQERADAIKDDRVRATTAAHALIRLLMDDGHRLELSAPATTGQLADLLEATVPVVRVLQERHGHAVAQLEGVQEALRTLFGAVPRRWAAGMTPPRPVGTKPPDPAVERWDSCGRPGDHGAHLGGDGTWNCRGFGLMERRTIAMLRGS